VRLVREVRELNRNGILPTLSELDQALHPIFVAEDDHAGLPQHQTSVEMSSQVCPSSIFLYNISVNTSNVTCDVLLHHMSMYPSNVV